MLYCVRLLYTKILTHMWTVLNLHVGLGLYFVCVCIDLAFCVFLWVSLDHSVLLAFVVPGLVPSVRSQEIGWKEWLRNEPFCVDCGAGRKTLINPGNVAMRYCEWLRCRCCYLSQVVAARRRRLRSHRPKSSTLSSSLASRWEERVTLWRALAACRAGAVPAKARTSTPSTYWRRRSTHSNDPSERFVRAVPR